MRIAITTVFMAAGLCLAGSGSNGASPEEYQVKAAFVFNFAKFVEWPSGAFQNGADPIAICILGPDPFGRTLEEIVAGKVVGGRSVTVRRIPTVKQSAGCHILFIGSENKRIAALLADIKPPGILTVGESEGGAPEGIVINFRIDGGKVRFDIDTGAAERQKLRISARLLSLAHAAQSTGR